MNSSSKKILIAVLIVAVILAVTIVVVMLMPTANKAPANTPVIDDNTASTDATGDSSVSSVSSVSEYQYDGKNKEFYQYGNYILNGKKNVTSGLDLGNYNEGTKYSLAEAIASNNLQFINQAGALWKAFLSSGSEVLASVQKQTVMMNFLEKYAGMNTRTEEEMWKLYYEVGLDSATRMIKSDYVGLASIPYDAGLKWAEAKSAWSEAALRLYAGYDGLGCIKNNEFDQECINKNKAELKEIMLEYKKAKNAVDETKFTMENLATEIIKNCFEIRNALAGANNGGGGNE